MIPLRGAINPCGEQLTPVESNDEVYERKE
jgi:hypothetical protein